MLNRCVTYSDSGLTWEGDPRHAELAEAGLGLQSARQQTSSGGPKPNAPCDHEELELDGQRKPTTACQRHWHIWHQTDPASQRPARNAAAQLGKHQRGDQTRLKRPRAVWEFPPDEESIVTVDGLSDADAAGCPKTRRSTSGGCLRVGQHTSATWSSTQKVVSLSSAKSCERGHRVGQHCTRAGTRGSRTNLDGCCSSTRTGSPQWERRRQTHGNKVLLAAAEREKPGARDREDTWHSQFR